jgi:hypothetical protein
VFLTVDQRGTETNINLNYVVSFCKEGPTPYGTTLFLVSMANGEVFQLNKEDSDRFMNVFNSKIYRDFFAINEDLKEDTVKILREEHGN